MGRPLGYAPNDALERATNLFRVRGFRATSIQDIVEATGLNRFAIYEKFGGKEGLFYSALEAYFETAVKQRLLAAIRAENAGIDALLDLLALVRDSNLDPDTPPGCLIVNASLELGGRDERVERVAAEYVGLLTDAVGRALERAEKCGDLLPGRPIEARADYVVTLLTGVMGLAHVSRALADKLIRVAIGEVESWRRAVPTARGAH